MEHNLQSEAVGIILEQVWMLSLVILSGMRLPHLSLVSLMNYLLTSLNFVSGTFRVSRDAQFVP